MKKLLMGLALFMAPDAANAQTAAPDADPALWSVKDEDTTIYLFGTFHLLDGRSWFNDEVRTAFDASQELVLEARIPENPADLQPLIVRYAVDPNGRRLSQRLTPAQNEAVTRSLEELGIPAGAFEPLEPWFATLTLGGVAVKRLGIDSERGPEAVLTRAAREGGLPINELEGMEAQFRLFDGMSEEQQMTQLSATLENLDIIADRMAPMLAAWSAGNVDELVAILNANSREHPELHRLVFTDRNAAWADWVEERLKRPGTVFMAVGAGHLAGEGSLIAQLEQRNLLPTRVTR